MGSTRETLKVLIARVCGDLMPDAVPDEARLGDPAQWDSLAHVALMTLIEETFGRPVGPVEMAGLTSLEEIERWLARASGAEVSSPAPTRPEVADALRSVGLAAGDLVMVHAFTAALGITARADRVLIDALLDVLGPEGTLVLPAFTYSFCQTGIFEPDRSPSEVGIAADTLRREYSGLRSRCPIFSVVAVGPLAPEIGALRPETTFGPDSIFGLMLERQGKLCAIGVGYDRVTFNHYVEEELQVPYRYWKRFEGVIRSGGRDEPVGVDYYVRSLDPEAEQDFMPAHRLVSGQSFSGHATVGGAQIHCAPAQDYHRVLRGAMDADPLLLLTPQARRHWDGDQAPRKVAGLRDDPGDARDEFATARRLAEALAADGEPAEAHRVLVEAAAAAGDYATLTGACRWARRLLPAAEANQVAPVKVSWTGSATLHPLAEACETYVRASGIIPETIVGEFGQFRGELAEAASDADVIFVRVAPEALRPELDGWRYGGGDPQIARAAARELCVLVQRWLEDCQGHAVIHLTTPWHHSAMGLADSQLADGSRAVAATFNTELVECAVDHVRLHVLDETPVVLQTRGRAYDADLYYHAGIDLSGPAIAAVGREAARFVVATRRPPVKCIVTDLDNTLWGGTVGEDGVNGLSLAGEYPGEAHRELQRWLLAHHRAGILLAICSKNERSDGLAPFQQRPDMILSPEHFAAISIDWRPKPSRILEIAQELNIGVDSVAFIDDSPFERAAVREALPEITVPELPRHVSRWIEHLSELHLSDMLLLTEEDRRRASMYAEQRKREHLAETVEDMTAFLNGLGSVAALHFDDPAIVARTAQLCARTNQFNLSSRRHSEGQISRFIDDESARVIQMSAGDRFGELGVVGIAIVLGAGETAELDTLLLSCRALGRGLEHALLSEAWRVASDELGATTLLAQWLDNGRNGQVREFMEAVGAHAEHVTGESVTYRIERPVDWPEHIERAEA